MLVNVSGHHVDLTPALRSYVEEKMNKLEKHFNHITSMHVVLSVEKRLHQKAKAEVHVSGSIIVAEAESTDMYASIDNLSHKLNEQIIKHKDKIQEHHHSSFKGMDDII